MNDFRLNEFLFFAINYSFPEDIVHTKQTRRKERTRKREPERENQKERTMSSLNQHGLLSAMECCGKASFGDALFAVMMANIKEPHAVRGMLGYEREGSLLDSLFVYLVSRLRHEPSEEVREELRMISQSLASRVMGKEEFLDRVQAMYHACLEHQQDESGFVSSEERQLCCSLSNECREIILNDDKRYETVEEDGNSSTVIRYGPYAQPFVKEREQEMLEMMEHTGMTEAELV